MIYAVKKNESFIRLVGLFFLGDYMLVHRKHDSELYLGFRPVPFFFFFFFFFFLKRFVFVCGSCVIFF